MSYMSTAAIAIRKRDIPIVPTSLEMAYCLMKTLFQIAICCVMQTLKSTKLCSFCLLIEL